MTLLLLPASLVQLDGRRGRFFRLSYIMVLLVIIGMTHSAGSWFLCVACIAFIASMHLMLKMKPIDALTVGMVVFGIGMVMIVAVVANADALLWMIGKDPTMTGRTQIWSSLMVSILKRPFVGYGYMSFWQGLKDRVGEHHIAVAWQGVRGKGVLELWLELGAVAVLLYALAFSAVLATLSIVYGEIRPRHKVVRFRALLCGICESVGWKPFCALTLECVLPFVAYAGLRSASRRIRGLQAA